VRDLFWLLLSLLLLLLLVLLIIMTKLTILVDYYHLNDDDDLKVEFRIWFGLIKYKIHVPTVKVDEDSPSIVVKSHSQAEDSDVKDSEGNVNKFTKKDFIKRMESTKELLHKVVQLNVIVQSFLKKINVKKFEWNTLIGLGDAAHTGIITGVLWGIKGGILGLLSKYLSLREAPQLSITPHFQAAVIQTRVQCIFQFRIGHAILAGLKMIKFWRGGMPKYKNERNIAKEKMNSV